MPLDQRIEQIAGCETVPLRFMLLRHVAQYGFVPDFSSDTENLTTRVVDVCGPCETVPRALIIENAEQKRRLIKYSRTYNSGLDYTEGTQLQVHVRETGVFLNYVDGHRRRLLDIVPLQQVHFCQYTGHSEYIGLPGFAEEMRKRQWEPEVDALLDFALRSGHLKTYAGNRIKITWNTEETRDKVLKILDGKDYLVRFPD